MDWEKLDTNRTAEVNCFSFCFLCQWSVANLEEKELMVYSYRVLLKTM